MGPPVPTGGDSVHAKSIGHAPTTGRRPQQILKRARLVSLINNNAWEPARQFKATQKVFTKTSRSFTIIPKYYCEQQFPSWPKINSVFAIIHPQATNYVGDYIKSPTKMGAANSPLEVGTTTLHQKFMQQLLYRTESILNRMTPYRAGDNRQARPSTGRSYPTPVVPKNTERHPSTERHSPTSSDKTSPHPIGFTNQVLMAAQIHAAPTLPNSVYYTELNAPGPYSPRLPLLGILFPTSSRGFQAYYGQHARRRFKSNYISTGVIKKQHPLRNNVTERFHTLQGSDTTIKEVQTSRPHGGNVHPSRRTPHTLLPNRGPLR